MGRRVTDEEMRGWEWMTREGPHEAREAIGRLIAEVRRLRVVMRALKRGDCWCEKGIGNLMVKEHTTACVRARALADG